MKVSKNFDIREFVPKEVWDAYGKKSTWFINERVVKLAQFYKDYFTKHFKNEWGDDKVKSVIIKVNDWHYGGSMQYRGFRPIWYDKGGKLSQHRQANAFDCDIIVSMTDGSRKEADYSSIHRVILGDQTTFMRNGLAAIEDVAFAPTWLHSDCRWIPNQKDILVVKP